MAKTLKRADVSRLRRKMKKLYPEAQFMLADYGFSLSVRNPAGTYGSRLTYVFRPERDGATGYLIVSKERLAEVAVLLAAKPSDEQLKAKAAALLHDEGTDAVPDGTPAESPADKVQEDPTPASTYKESI